MYHKKSIFHSKTVGINLRNEKCVYDRLVLHVAFRSGGTLGEKETCPNSGIARNIAAKSENYLSNGPRGIMPLDSPFPGEIFPGKGWRN